MSGFLNKRLSGLAPYVPGEQPRDMEYVKLNTNESPFPPAPGVLRAVNYGEIKRLNLYPDPTCGEIKKKLAERYNKAPENIFVSNGSDDILNFAFLAYGAGGVVFPEISYGFYKVYANFHGLEYTALPLREDFTIKSEDYSSTGKMVVLANPNAPTGIFLGLSEIEKIVASNPGSVVLIDEAYVDFGGESASSLTEKYGNLLVVQTFSKSRALAGGRLGFAVGHKALIEDLERIKYYTNPYSINRLTLAAGIASIESDSYYAENCKRIINTREKTAAALRALGFEVLPSSANFLFARSGRISGRRLYEQLKKRGVLVRHFPDEKIKDFNRITVGTEKQMDILLQKIKEIQGDAL